MVIVTLCIKVHSIMLLLLIWCDTSDSSLTRSYFLRSWTPVAVGPASAGSCLFLSQISTFFQMFCFKLFFFGNDFSIFLYDSWTMFPGGFFCFSDNNSTQFLQRKSLLQIDVCNYFFQWKSALASASNNSL